MADEVPDGERRWAVRPLFLFPFLAIMAVGMLDLAFIAVSERDWKTIGYLAGLASTFWFYYRNPALLNGTLWSSVEDFRAAVDVEFLWIGFALMFASLFVF